LQREGRAGDALALLKRLLDSKQQFPEVRQSIERGGIGLGK
jgi:hypothetical protein